MRQSVFGTAQLDVGELLLEEALDVVRGSLVRIEFQLLTQLVPAQGGDVLAVDGSGAKRQPVRREVSPAVLGLDLSVQRRAQLRGVETGHNSSKGIVRDAAPDAQPTATPLRDLSRPLFDAA